MLPDTHVDCTTCSRRSKSVFGELNADEVELLSAAKKCAIVKKGDALFHEGAYPRGVHCVHSGKIKISQTGAEGREQIVHLAKDADVLGYRAILGRDKYSCSAVAIEDSQVCFIPADVFNNLVERNPKVAHQVINLLSALLKQTERQVTAIAQRPVKERIAQSLLQLSECYGFEKDGITISVVITREEIANISGTTRETATRILFELKGSGVIDLNGKYIAILRPRELMTIANYSD